MLFSIMLNYRPCKVYQGAPEGEKPSLDQDWYVYYYFNANYKFPLKPKKFIRSGQIKKGINRFKTVKERNAAASQIVSWMDNLLMKGFNPYESEEYNMKVLSGEIKASPTVVQPAVNDAPVQRTSSGMNIEEAIEWAITKKADDSRWYPDLPGGYSTVFNRFVAACKKAGYMHLDVADFDVLNARDILSTLEAEHNLSDAGYLRHKEILNIIFNVLVDWKKVSVNPFKFRSSKRRLEPEPKPEFTEEERSRIKETFTKINPRMYAYFMVEYHTHVRPVEIFRIQIKYVDLKNRQIFLPRKNTKTKHGRYVIISNSLLPYLESLNMGAYDPEMYLFGENYYPEHRSEEKADKKAKSHAKKVSKVWHLVVKMGLGIDKNMYWIKNEGINSKIDAGVDLQTVRLQTGHKTLQQTAAYMTKDPRRKAIKQKLTDIDDDF